MSTSDGLLTLGRWTSDRARIAGDHTAIIDRGLATTYRQLDERETVLSGGKRMRHHDCLLVCQTVVKAGTGRFLGEIDARGGGSVIAR